MQFILELWPDDVDESPGAALRYAVESIKRNPDLVWDIRDDSGSIIAVGVKVTDE
jgi:hypothetical protein